MLYDNIKKNVTPKESKGDSKANESTVITNTERKNQKKKDSIYEKAKPMLAEGGVYDEETKHILTKDCVELKYCIHCGRWLPVEMFHRETGNKRDGLQCYCRECVSKYGKNRNNNRKKTVKTEVVKTEQVKTDSIESKFNEIKVLIGKENDNLKQTIRKQEEEIQQLNADYKSLLKEKDYYKDLFDNCLVVFEKKGIEYEGGKVRFTNRIVNKEEVERYLNTHNDITPRVLINSLSRFDDRYRFYCKDTVTGLTTSIVEEVYA